MGRFIKTNGDGRAWSGLIWLCLASLLAAAEARGEVIFRDFFTGAAGNITNSAPELDVQGDGWQAALSAAPPQVDGAGHLYDPSTTSGGAAGVRLIANGPYGAMTLGAAVDLEPGTVDWIGLGFNAQIGFLTDGAAPDGPWLKISASGTLTLYGGAGQNNGITIANAFANTGAPLTFLLTYDAYLSAATVSAVSGGTTNILINALPVTNTFAGVNPLYAMFQFPTNAAAPQQRWVGAVWADWLPRPRPLVQLPASTNIIKVGAPTGGSDIAQIKTALDAAAAVGGAEVRFETGATYIISNNVAGGGVPLTLSHAANVLINGNGCNILIKNPYIGFLEAAYCTNIIMQGFSVDYDPLPFTQGVVTSNLAPSAPAFLFRVDPGYPAPTNENYLAIANWGIFMDRTQPGRLADGHASIYDFNTVTATATSNIFKVRLKNYGKIDTIAPGDIWCQLARYNGSPLFRARFSSNVTFLDLTVYAGAAAAFAAADSALVNEIGCQVMIGPSPGGANGVPRRKTTNADGGFFTNPRIGPWVEGNNFIGLSDDVANANTLPFFAVAPVPDCGKTFHLAGYDTGGAIVDLTAGQMAVGDDISFYNGTNGVVFDRATVTAINPPEVTFDHSICGVAAGTNTTDTCIFDNSLNTSAVYLNNQFSNSRIHGIYCRANNILIAHNVISGMGFSAVAAQPDLSLAGPNSFIPTNAVIIDNVFQDSGFSYESTNDADPGAEPVWAEVELHKAISGADYVPTGPEISGIRILNNAFLQWRRGAIALHNVSDCRIRGNYFGPPSMADSDTLTNLLIDLWACDYGSVEIDGNVKPPGFIDAISEDGSVTTVGGAFRSLSPPQLNVARGAGSVAVSWFNAVPGFVLQKTDTLGSGWLDATNQPYVSGASNVVRAPVAAGIPAQFYRARQR